MGTGGGDDGCLNADSPGQGALKSAGYLVGSELNPLAVQQRGENDRATAEQAEVKRSWSSAAHAQSEEGGERERGNSHPQKYY